MKKSAKISTKIKVLGALLIVLMISGITTTIYLNQNNVKDALMINIAGKQRMLTQKMTKSIFYTYYSDTQDFSELNNAVDAFEKGLNILEFGDAHKGLYGVPTRDIASQLSHVRSLWKSFSQEIENFKLYSVANGSKNAQKLHGTVERIHEQNSVLLDEVDKLVGMYTTYSETKTHNIKIFQYLVAFVLMMLLVYALLQLKAIEAHVDEFMNYSKNLVHSIENNKLEPLQVTKESEEEIKEVSDMINRFIEKINSAMEFSNEALTQSQQASAKLEEITDEFDDILDDLKDKSLSMKFLNNSEDIVIESTENLIRSTKKLQKLKKDLIELTKSCQKS
ncbi:MAG: type IV pili methyl-accepting chemotaxis transducer N-terminal domain-containing protein [Epsilonproteobacteria bacterium]|nr:type IV pili methyl-accepting chemotaxis transducer N-terminal domain-containing protein [Campylobacterota bacterium]